MGDTRLNRSHGCRIARSSHLLSRFRPGEIKKFEQGFQLFGATPRAVGILRLRDLCHLDKRQLHEQALVAALSVAQVALVHQFQSLVEELRRARLSLRAVLGALLLTHLEQLQRLLVLSHEHVAHVRGESVDEVTSVEALFYNRVQEHHTLAHLVRQRIVDKLEVVVGVQLVEVFYHLFVRDVALAEARRLVEDGERVAHSAVGFLGYERQSLLLVRDAFLLSHMLQVVDGVLYGHSLEVVYLTTRENGRQNLVLLGGGEYEHHVSRRLLERLQKGVEGSLREHVHLVDNEHLVLAHLRRYACLLHERLDVLYGVVAGCVELEDVVRAALRKRLAALALAACLAVCRGVHAVDCLGEDARTRRLAYSARSAEQVGVCQFATLHGILQRSGESSLPHHRVERHRAVFTRRYYIFSHLNVYV